MTDPTEGLTSKTAGAVPANQPAARRSRKLIEIIAFQLEALRTHHRAVLDTQAVDAIHKMRVTTRRLQASLDLLEREMKVRKLKGRLRDWRRKLSSVRNYDVFLELIAKEAATRGRTRREQLELVKSILEKERLERSAAVREFLEGVKIDPIAKALGLATPSPSEPHDPSRGSDDSRAETHALETAKTSSINEKKVAGYAAERLDQRLAEFQALAAQSHPTNNPLELHQLRIAAKRVRYLMEIVSEMGYGDAARALVWLRSLQDRIGDWHDLEALEEEIVAIVASRNFMKQHLAESSQMLLAAAHLQKKKTALVARLFPVRVPILLEATSLRLARALRRDLLSAQKRKKRGPV